VSVLVSLRRVAEMVKKELRQIFRDPRLRGLIFVAPVMQLLVFGYAVSTDIRNTTLFVVDHDGGQSARELVDGFTASGYFQVVGRSPRPSDLVSALDHGDAVVGLEIPIGFQRDLRQGAATVQLLFDGTNSNVATVAQGYAERIALTFGVRTSAARSAVPVGLEERAWFNPSLESRNYNVPAVAGAIIMLVALLLTSLAIVREREMGTLEQLMVSPLRASELIAGKTIPFAIIGLIDLGVVFSLALFWFEIPFRGSFGLLLLASVLYLLPCLGVGLFISTISHTQQEAFMTSFLFFMPTILLSGFMFPVSSMPDIFAQLTLVNPMRHYLEIIRAIFLKGAGVEALRTQYLTLLGMGVTVLTLAALRFRKNVG
jgi:ABC-2 type transport system permease protein